jgi:hypothetical protein
MAFNPFSAFRKYQKYWMAGAVLICMLTFVLCSGGIKGTGLDDWILRRFGRRGEMLVEVNGRSYHFAELDEIKKQRGIANEFMRELLTLAGNRMDTVIKQLQSTDAAGKADPQRTLRLSLLNQCLIDVRAKLDRDAPRYFLGGTKLDDLVDFICWRDLADTCGVAVTRDTLNDFVRNACHGWVWEMQGDEVEAATQEILYYKLHASNRQATESVLKEALKQEFRVQIIQLAMAARWLPTDERNKIANIPSGRDTFEHIYLNTPMEFRVTPTPEQINAHFRKVRTELTIELLPVSLEALAKQVELPTDRKEKLEVLKRFYMEHKGTPYNPSQDLPGFKFPAQVEVQYLAANAGMEYYQQAAHVLTELQKAAPVTYNPMFPEAERLGYFATALSWDARLQKSLEVQRENFKNRAKSHFAALSTYLDAYWKETNDKTKADLKLRYDLMMAGAPPAPKDSASSLTTPHYYSPGQFNQALEKPNKDKPFAAAAIIGGAYANPFTGWSVYQGEAYREQAAKIVKMGALDASQRAKVGTELFLSQVPRIGGLGAFTAAGLTYQADLTPQFLPIAGYLEKDAQNAIENQLAQNWVNAAMLDAKRQLESAKGENAFRQRLEKLRSDYSRKITEKDGKEKVLLGFDYARSTGYRTDYDIESDERLKPLVEGFVKNRFFINEVEGRTGKPDALKDSDFPKLFFGTEPLGVGPTSTFVPKVWPPYLTAPKARQSLPLGQKSLEQRLFDVAEKPIIFWKSAKRDQEEKPWNPDDAKMVELVEQQYRLSKARPRLLEEVKKVANEVRKTQQAEGKDLVAKFRELAKQQGKEVLTLPNVSKLVPNTEIKSKSLMPYVDYELPRGRIEFPRADMVKQLLALNDLTAPLKTDTEAPERKTKGTETDPAAKRAQVDFEELNKINEELFLKPTAGAKTKPTQVQVLTNKPRSVYYIATITETREPRNLEYLKENPEFSPFGGYHLTFVDQVQQDLGKELMPLMSKYLRIKAGVDIPEKSKSMFADDSGS